MSVLSSAARLLNVFSFDFNLLPDGLSIGNLRTSDVRLNVEFTLHSVHENFQVQFAHSRDNRLTRFLIRPHSEGWIFFRQSIQCNAKALFIRLRLWLNSHGNHRL